MKNDIQSGLNLDTIGIIFPSPLYLLYLDKVGPLFFLRICMAKRLRSRYEPNIKALPRTYRVDGNILPVTTLITPDYLLNLNSVIEER